MSNKQKTKIAVAMSGGVDSSVVAFLLKRKGYQVIGLTMKLFKQKNNPAVKSAKKVCQKLKISHYIVNCQSVFRKKVINYFCQEYLQGQTPNPCIFCNRYIKFDFLLKKAKKLGADYLATGHYARLRRKIRNSKSDPVIRRVTPSNDRGEIRNKSKILNTKLLKGKDKRKDQSYFLYRLAQQQLKHALFPLGDLTKQQVRQIAKKNKLPMAERPESQEICFIPDNDYRQFIRNNCRASVKPGPILDKNEKILGQHQGLAFYTIGQRKGLNISSVKPLYVIKIDNKKNAIIVGSEKDLYQKELIVKNIHWINGQPKLPIQAMVKIRYKHQPSQAKIIYGYCSCEQPIKKLGSINKNLITVQLKKPQRAITPGQSAVFYKAEEVLGGGIID